jgi:elongation factor Ts
MISAQAVKELRERTGAGVVDCKAALEASNGDVEQAIIWLRQKGKASAAKKATRATREGFIANYIHGNGKVGVLVSVLCETDFVARSPRFQELAKNIALHIAAMDPVAIRPEDIDATLLASERAIAEEQAKTSGKPAAIQAKMIEGKLKTFAAERALLSQKFVKEPTKTVADLIAEAVSELGENISVGSFSRIII